MEGSPAKYWNLDHGSADYHIPLFCTTRRSEPQQNAKLRVVVVQRIGDSSPA